MTYRAASNATQVGVLSLVAVIALGPHGLAQPSPNPQVPPALKAAQALQPTPAETVQNGQQQVQMIFSPWARYCAKGPTEVCFTAADGHLASGQKLVIALLIEPAGGDTKLLRITLPLGVALVPGARILVDEKDPMTAPFVVCLPKSGCMADYKVDADLVEKLKSGQSLAIQAFDKTKPVSFTLPLTGFATAYEGPPGDSTVLNELQEGLPN